MQSNVRDDTVREIQHNIRINPLRLLCKVVVALHELGGIAFSDVEVTYRTLFMLMNDDRINQAFSPSESAIWTALSEYDAGTLPPWTSERGLLTNFKRNFHIFEWTGLFKRSHNGLIIANGDYEKTYAHIRTISQMAHNFQGFEPCYSQADIKQQMIDVVSSPKWGRYFDAFTMPVDTLVTLAGDEDLAGVAAFNDTAPIGTFDLGNQPFPPLSDFHSNQIRAFTQGANQIDPIETLVRREKANREHARILERLATLLRYHGHPASENVFIDLCSVTEGLEYIFEVKSNSEKNALSQIRKAIAQLYEYRYRSEKIGAVLCIVMQQKPRQDWVIDYLLNDREICICWMVDDVRLECPTQCHAALSRIGIV
jgi:Holliday junction resolvase